MLKPVNPKLRSRNQIAAAIAVVAVAIAAAPAKAHPHVFVTARAEIVFDETGAITAVRHIWQFDEAFSAYAVQGLDANNDGALTRTELQPLAQINVESLDAYDFFTWLYVGDEPIAFAFPTEYWLDIYEGRLTLFYTLPLLAPVAVSGEVALEVTDPEYFVAFAFNEERPIALVGAPAACFADYQPPQELDPTAAAQLAMIPAEQRELPEGLAALTADLANTIRVNC